MEYGIHSTYLKKNYNEIIENNAVNQVNPKTNDIIQPTIEIEPYIDICKSGTVTTATLLTLPSDKYFYLTNIHLSATGDAIAANVLNVVLFNGQVCPFTVYADGAVDSYASGGVINLNFPKRGILLAKGSLITATAGTGISGSYVITGYLSSDRAF